MQDLLTDPLWHADDLGRPMPDSPHAVSVCLPTWADNVGYEEGDRRVVQAMQSGYPRFFLHPFCRQLAERFAGDSEDCLVFPSPRTAEEFGTFLHSQTGVSARRDVISEDGSCAAVFPRSVSETARQGWQHFGSGISSRHAQALLREESPERTDAEKTALRNRIASLAGVDAGDVWLFPCGMNAAYAIHRALRRMFPDRRSVQFGFPYVDTLKILEKVGPGAAFFPRADEDEYRELHELLRQEPLAGIFTEFPSNPLLVSPDLSRLAEFAGQADCPLIVDETIAGFHNVDVKPVADVVWSSLTKFFSGRGDVTGGSVILNPNSRFASELRAAFEIDYEDTVFPADAVVLERNSRDYGERMPRINESAVRLAEFLADRKEITSVFHPSQGETSRYDSFRKASGGYSGLLSIVLDNPEERTQPFFDRLRICKGPNLGTNFSLACPFTLLAHYNELEFAESCGVSRWLVRVSVGLEDPEDLMDRFAAALDA